MTLSPSRIPTFTITPTRTRTPTQTRTPTIPIPFGPLITHFGVAKADGTVEQPISRTPDNIPIYCRLVGSGFLIVVEGRPGTSGKALGRSMFNSNPDDPSVRPDLQIEVDRKLGNGSTDICDRGPSPDPIGGIPAIDPPSFAVTQEISDALNDFGCRFDFHPNNDDACTKSKLGSPSFVASNSTGQFCSAPAVGVEQAFPEGQTLVSVRLRDSSDNIGNTAKIIIDAPCSP